MREEDIPNDPRNMKARVVRQGDFIWFGGERRLWRKLSKAEKSMAIREIEQDRRNSGSEDFFKSKKR